MSAERDTRRPSRLDPDELAALEEQRDFLLRSITDLDQEHAAGDLEDGDYQSLKDDYTARAAEVLRAIEQQKQGFAQARRPRSASRTAMIIAGVLAFGLVAGWAVARSMGAREAGDTITGGIDVKQSPSQRAQACVQMINPSSPSAAVECFREVLDEDPRNPVANTWLGWQIGMTASLAQGDDAVALEKAAEQLVEQAIAVDPNYSYARAFRAVLAYRRGDFELAKKYLEEFEANDPSPDARSVIEQQQLAQKIDEALAQGSTTTAPPSTTPPTSAPG
ncbi:MAG: tetratricopeptide repeat protein [Microthrixaceae bacterium]|nr:tetratricopeptide repeat protein [Acidimicrobiales bacterium]MCB9404020.1 tetratricopeptide repeat protein [Microthrixaceae bacterium]